LKTAIHHVEYNLCINIASDRYQHKGNTTLSYFESNIN